MATQTRTLFTFDPGDVLIVIDIDDVAENITVIRGINRTNRPCRVLISELSGGRQTISTLPANTTQEVRVTLSPGSRVRLTPITERGLWDGLNCIVQYPSN